MLKIKWLIVAFSSLRLFPHLLFFFVFKNRCYADVKVGMEHQKCGGPVWAGFLFLMTFEKTYRNIFYYRIGYYKFFISFLAPAHNSFIIGTHAEIGEGFLAIHPIGTIIDAKIGRNFIVKQNATVGRNGNDNPIVGDNVTVNANALVIGNITVGNNVEVGAGTILMKSVPDNCVVVGNPAYILKENGVRVNRKL